MSAAAYRQLHPGEPAPWFSQRSTSNPAYVFDTVGGRYVLLAFFGSAAHAGARRALDWLAQQRERFDDVHLSCFGLSVDPQDEAGSRVSQAIPGIRHFWDFDRRVSRLFGALPLEPGGEREVYRPLWVLLNPNLQVRAVIPFEADGSDTAQLARQLAGLPEVARFAGLEMHAPVLLVSDIFEPSFCRVLIEQYERSGGQPTGFMRERDGITVFARDPGHKVRRDHVVDDAALCQQVRQRIRRSVVPAIERVHQYQATRIERYLVGCYDESDGGHFRPHRDNTTRGTAHRRFALSINLNADFDGGELVFPEYGPRRYKPPPGAGVVFSCSLLHAVEPVRRGRRYAFLPFLYDDAAAALREANLKFLEAPP